VINRVSVPSAWTDGWSRSTLDAEGASGLRVERESLVLPSGVNTPKKLVGWLMTVSEASIEHFGYVEPTMFAMQGDRIYIFEARDRSSSASGSIDCFAALREASRSIPGAIRGFVATGRIEPLCDYGVFILSWDESTQKVSVGTVAMTKTQKGWGCEPSKHVPAAMISKLRLTL
jgi:hypothetical protein